MMNSSTTNSVSPLYPVTTHFISACTHVLANQAVQPASPIISAYVMYLGRLVIGFALPIVVQSFGIATNIINLVVFCKSDLSDGVSLSFLALSGVDLGYLFFSLATRTSFTLENVFFVRLYANLSALGQVLIFYTALFQDLAALVTLFVAVQKTLCVTLPFLFKGVFTRLRCRIVIGVIFSSGLAYYIPLFALQGLGAVFNPLTNVTRLGYSYSSDTLTLITVYKVVNRMFLPVLTQSILVTCLALPTVKLKKSTRFRQGSAAVQIVKHELLNPPGGENVPGGLSGNTNPTVLKTKVVSNRPSVTKLSGRELRAVRAVFTTTVVFVICNFGDVVIKFSSMVYPEFEDFYTRAHYNTYVLVNLIQALLSNVGASVNMFIYLRYNTRFYEQFCRSFGWFIGNSQT